MARTHTFSMPDAEEDFWEPFIELAKKNGGVSKIIVQLLKEWYAKESKKR